MSDFNYWRTGNNLRGTAAQALYFFSSNGDNWVLTLPIIGSLIFGKYYKENNLDKAYNLDAYKFKLYFGRLFVQIIIYIFMFLASLTIFLILLNTDFPNDNSITESMILRYIREIAQGSLVLIETVFFINFCGFVCSKIKMY